MRSADGRVYYHNQLTDATAWELPAELAGVITRERAAEPTASTAAEARSLVITPPPAGAA